MQCTVKINSVLWCVLAAIAAAPPVYVSHMLQGPLLLCYFAVMRSLVFDQMTGC